MNKKILSTFAVLTMFLTTVNVIAISSDEDNNMKINEENDHVLFSQATIESKGEYLSVNVKETNTFLSDTGKPLLPAFTKTFTFPFGTKIKNVECIISDITSEVIDGKIQPSPRPVPRISIPNSAEQSITEEKTNDKENTYEDESVYSSSDLYPDIWYKYKVGRGLYNGKDTIFVKVNIYPVRYSPLENTLYYANNIDIKISFEKGLNKESFARTYDLLIITPQKFKLQLIPLYLHKVKMGVSTKIITVESIYKNYNGSDKPEQIKYCIKDAKETWNITYVLLFGGLKSLINGNDKDNKNEGSIGWHVPVRYANVNYEWGEPSHISDLYYADLYKGDAGEFEDWDPNGNGAFADKNDDIDLYPDVYYGRLPCSTAFNVRTMVKKIIRYEKPTILGKPWMKRMVVVGGMTTDMYYEGQPDGEWLCNKSMEYMGDLITSPVRVFASNIVNGGPQPIPKDIVKQYSVGEGYVLFQGHGNTWMWDTHWPNTDGNWTGGITNLDMKFRNNRKLPIVVIGGCHNGLFNVSLKEALNDDPTGENTIYHTYGSPIIYCFSWKMCVKARGGAIASTGCTAYGLGSSPPDELSGGLESYIFYEIGQNDAKTIGEAHSGSITKYVTETDIGQDDVYVITEYQLFGDPSLKIGGY